MLRARLLYAETMRTRSWRLWLLLSIVASMATQCDESPRGALPTPIVTVELRLVSQPAPEPSPDQQAAVDFCLQRMNNQNSVIPSWRNGEVVTLQEVSPTLFRWEFFDVPVGVAHTMSVHDRNECRRNPSGNGSVLTGVSVNNTPILRIVPNTRVLTFVVDADGVVSSPVAMEQTLP